MTIAPQTQSVVGIVIAGPGGAAVGLEREWPGHASGPEVPEGVIRDSFRHLGTPTKPACRVCNLVGFRYWIATRYQACYLIPHCVRVAFG